MANVLATNSYDITIVQVASLPRLLFKPSAKAHVQINAANISWSTEGMEWKNGGNVSWEKKVTLPSLSTSDSITFSLTRDHTIFSKARTKASEGSLEITVAQLQEKSRLSVFNKAISLSLQKKGKETCKLTVRFATSSTAASLSSAMDPLPEISTQISEPGRTPAVADAIAAAGDIVANVAQSDLVGSLTTLVGNLSIVVKIGDEVAKIHPWASLAWSVLSVGLKLVKAQHDRDIKIAALIETMQSTYATVLGSEVVKDERLQDVLDRILKQTVECGFFVQRYARSRSFAGPQHDRDIENVAYHYTAGKAVTEPFSHTDGLAARYQDTFEQLRKEFQGRITVKVALMTANIATTVNAIRFDQLLEQLKPADMDQSARGTCLPGTRLKAIQSIWDWYTDDSDSRENAMWIYGVAGAGKSTLSTTIARMMGRFEDVNLLGGFFFFNRAFPHRSASTLIRTLAYQLARFDPIIGARIESILTDVPGIADQPLATQFSTLLSASALGDIPRSRGPVLIVIDALDESGSAADQQALMRVLADGVSKLPFFLRLFIVSRPEREIVNGLKNVIMRREELTVDPETSRADIAAFIRFQLNEVQKGNLAYLGEGWPGDREFNVLVDRASGHFIWADTACRMIADDIDPKGKLDDLIRQQPTNSLDDTFGSLYQLYKTALDSAVNWSNPKSRAHARDLLSAVISAQAPISCSAINDLLGQDLPFSQTMSRLGSVLSLTDKGTIRILHTSFYEYLTAHSMAEPWALSIVECNSQLANGCVSLLARTLKENMCDLVLPHAITNERLPEAISYAASFWIDHVCLINKPSKDLADTIDRFMHDHLLHWMEALSIGKTFDVALRSLPILLKWIQENFPRSELFDFVQDAHRFARYFEHTIIEHPLFIYISALPFTPRNTIIYKTFYHERLPHVVAGVEPEWPPLLQMLHGHEGYVQCVCFSPDGTRIVSGSSDNTVRVWDALSGQLALPPLQGHEDRVTSVGFSPDGSRIVSGSSDNTVRVWDALTGQPALPPLQGHKDAVWSVCFSPDGSRIVSGSSDNTVRVWDALSGQSALMSLWGHGDRVTSVCFSPDGSRIVSGSSDWTVRVWDALTGQPALPPLQGHEGPVTSVCFSPDGSRIVSGSEDKTVRVWDALTGQPALPPLQGHEGPVHSVCFSPDGSRIVSGSADTTVRVWHALSGQPALPPLQGRVGVVISVCFSPDGSRIVSGSSDEIVRVWDALSGQPALPPLQGHADRVMSVCFSPDGSRFVSGSSDNTVRVWDALTGQPALPPLQGHEGPVWSVCFSSDGSRIVLRSRDDSTCVWDACTGHPIVEDQTNDIEPPSGVTDHTGQILGAISPGFR
ncbi:hypothetical protein HWV62_31107 [Athelia sp. TMB]|nr:hypothetical protein HWV62_31107 [Athelia sp. TMB]